MPPPSGPGLWHGHSTPRRLQRKTKSSLSSAPPPAVPIGRLGFEVLNFIWDFVLRISNFLYLGRQSILGDVSHRIHKAVEFLQRAVDGGSHSKTLQIRMVDGYDNDALVFPQMVRQC